MRHVLSICGVLAALSLAAVGAGCASGFSEGTGSIEKNFELGGPQETVRLAVGSKDFTEQQVLGQITIQALQAAGAETIDRTSLGDTETLRRALISSKVDLYWEYTGTGWLIHLAEADAIADPKKQYEAVSKADLKQNGVEWLKPAPANNTYALAVRGGAFDKVENISDLEGVISNSPKDATFCAGPEFNERADGLPGLEEKYGFEFPRAGVFVLPDTTVYGAVEKGEKCNFGSVFETDGRVPEMDLRLLKDDKEFFAAYNPSLNMRQETLKRYPELKDLFTSISTKLDTKTLRKLSADVELNGGDPAKVAERWLSDNGFT